MNNKSLAKKMWVAALWLSIFLVFCACRQNVSNPPVTDAANTANVDAAVSGGASTDPGRSISFKYFYRGFTAISLYDEDSFNAFDKILGERIIQTEDDWQDFMGNFCPGIFYWVSVDFSRQSLIATTSFGAKPSFTYSSDIESIDVRDGQLEIKEVIYETGICALNTNETTHFFINIVVVDDEDLPADINDLIYVKS